MLSSFPKTCTVARNKNKILNRLLDTSAVPSDRAEWKRDSRWWRLIYGMLDCDTARAPCAIASSSLGKQLVQWRRPTDIIASYRRAAARSDGVQPFHLQAAGLSISLCRPTQGRKGGLIAETPGSGLADRLSGEVPRSVVIPQ